MDPIGRRPVAVKSPSQPARTEAPPAAPTANAAVAVGHTLKNSFDAPGVKATQAKRLTPRRRAARSTWAVGGNNVA